MAISPVRSRLQPYLPRLTLEWLADDPERRHREVDGSVVFVDISGFTALSEKLARLGREGAEEMAASIDACFGELLAVAYEGDGSLLKFGGDALLLLFSGGEPVDHAARAARAAVAMRARLRTAGKLATAGGKVTLRMSVGVHTGRFDVFLVGDSHRELIVTGPAATRVVTMEGTASAGQIVVSSETAALLPARCVGDPAGEGSLLRAAPPGESASTAWVLPEVDDELLERCIPVATRETVLAATGEPEHRQASVAFLHFEGIDEALRRDGVARVTAELDRLVAEVQAAADELGVCFLGSDVDADGGKLILTAGVPRAVGEDEERLLLALRHVVDAGGRIPVRLGVNHGPVFAGDIGPAYRRTFTVMGDTVNLAARLMANAPPGQIYATGSILERSATRFETVELEPFSVKGKARPVHAWSVGPSIGRPKRTAAEEFELLGREQETDLVRRVVAEVDGGTRRTIVLHGDAGIGKTRLLDEITAACRGYRSLGATGETFTSTTPYVAWRDVLRDRGGLAWEATSEQVVDRLRELVLQSDPSLLPWLPLIAIAADAEMASTPEVDAVGPEFRRAKVNESVIGFLRAVCPGPTVFAFEDAHLMDEASADLLAALVGDDRVDRPWLVAVLRQPGSAGFSAPSDPSVVTIDVPPLADESATRLVHVATDEEPLAEHQVERIVARAQGNPQLVLDLIHAVRSGDDELPESVEAAATVRIDRLTPNDRALVRRLSVFGLAFHPRFLDDVLAPGEPRPDDVTWDRLSDFFESEASGYLRFRRAVVRDVAYAGLPYRTRKRLHLAVGLHWERESTEPEESAGLLSLHFSRAGEHDKAWRYARVAGDHAFGIFANAEASSLYERAIDAGRKLKVEASSLRAAYEQLGLSQQRTGAFADARRSFAEAHRLATEPLDRVTLMMRRSHVEASVGSYPRALRWLTRARRELEGLVGPEAERIRVELDYRYASILLDQGKVEEAARRSERAIADAEAAGAIDIMGHAANILGNALAWLGRPGADDELCRALEIYREQGFLPGQAMVQLNRGAGAYWEGRWADATDLYMEALNLHERTGNPVEAAFARINLAEIYLEQGRLVDAEQSLLGASRTMRASGDLTGLAASLGFLGRVSVRAGRLDEAAQRYAGARAAYEQLGTRSGVFEVDALAAELDMVRGAAAEALAEIDSILAHRDEDAGIELLEPLLERTKGYALLQLGRHDEAGAALRRSLSLASARAATFDVALAMLGLIRSDPTAEEAVSWQRDSDATLRQLHVVAVPSFPMTAAPASAGAAVAGSLA